jgi:Pyruvate/2-oxoacid:ferredoxin oxidoreductase gamma subunit
MLDYAQKNKVHVFPVPVGIVVQDRKAIEHSQLSKITRMINVSQSAFPSALLKYDKSLVEKAIKATFPEKIAPMNITHWAKHTTTR